MKNILIVLVAFFSFQSSESFAQENHSAYVQLAQEPSFPGGEGAMLNFLANTARYPRAASEQGLSGTVYAEFVVNKDGSISDAKIVKGVAPSLDNEVIRLIKLMPKWRPGRLKNGEIVRALFTLPVQFDEPEYDTPPTRKERKASRRAKRKENK